MLIQPNTYIRLIEECPLSNNYINTLYFGSLAQQTKYFKETLNGRTFLKNSYQRYADGVIHLQVKADDVYNCNYLMFQNTSYGNKYFYAFITDIEYVNDVSCRIKYEIDEIQTWFFDYEENDCFVEREHTLTDDFGEHLIEEGLETGVYTLEQLDVTNMPFNKGEYGVLLVMKPTEEYEMSGIVVQNNTFCPLYYRMFEDAQSAASAINAIKVSENVVACYTVPRLLFENTIGSGDFYRDSFDYYTDVSINSVFPLETSFNGYVPKNKKLFTSKYTGLLITTSDGQTKEYGLEYFTHRGSPWYVAPSFRMEFCLTMPTARLVPNNYKMDGLNFEETITTKDFPVSPIIVDFYKEYLALNANKLKAQTTASIVSAVTSTAAGAVGGFVYGGVGGAIVGGVGGAIRGGTNVFNTVNTINAQKADAKVVSDTMVGDVPSGMSYASNRVGFIAYRYRVRDEFAKIIDNYFTQFGYAVNTLKKPSRMNRQYWSYVKTVGCSVRGKLPTSSAIKIAQIYDNGITFWNKDNIGVYGDGTNPLIENVIDPIG